MNDQRHPDIEIYIKSCSVAEIEAWLTELGDRLVAGPSHEQSHEYFLHWEGIEIPLILQEKVAGKAWSSVWFKSDQTPWLKDIDCARLAASGLKTQIRCIASSWKTGDDPDEWWQVEGGEEKLISWHT